MEVDFGIITLAGGLASILTSVINQAWWTPRRKQWVSFFVSIALGIVALIIKGTITAPPSDPLDLFVWVTTTVGSVAAASQIVYTQFSQKLKDLEVATTQTDPPDTAA